VSYEIIGDPISKMDDAYFNGFKCNRDEYNKDFKRYVDGMLIDDTYDKVDIEFVYDKVNRSGDIRMKE
jgi:hypothetical protein